MWLIDILPEQTLVRSQGPTNYAWEKLKEYKEENYTPKISGQQKDNKRAEKSPAVLCCCPGNTFVMSCRGICFSTTNKEPSRSPRKCMCCRKPAGNFNSGRLVGQRPVTSRGYRPWSWQWWRQKVKFSFLIAIHRDFCLLLAVPHCSTIWVGCFLWLFILVGSEASWAATCLLFRGKAATLWGIREFSIMKG